MKLYTLHPNPKQAHVALLEGGIKLEMLLYKNGEERAGILIKGPSTAHKDSVTWADNRLSAAIIDAPFGKSGLGKKTGTKTMWLDYANLNHAVELILDTAAPTTEALVLLLEQPGFHCRPNGVVEVIAEVRWDSNAEICYSRLLCVHQGTTITAGNQTFLWDGKKLAPVSASALNQSRRENVGYRR